MKSPSLEKFAKFHSVVDQVRDEIRSRSFGRRGEHDVYYPGIRDADERLFEAFELIKPALKRVTRPKIFQVPAYVPMMSPFIASSGHQAITLYHAAPELLRGSVDALDSPEWQTINDLAQRELKKLNACPIDPTELRSRKLRPGRGEIAQSLGRKLFAHHLPLDGGVITEPLTEDEMADMVGCVQSTASKNLKVIFYGGRVGYHAWLAGDKPMAGLVNRDAVGGVMYDAFANLYGERIREMRKGRRK